MRRIHTVLVAFSFAAALFAPSVAQAQPGDRPATQLFMAPTGRSLPKGEGYAKAIALAFPTFQGGLTDRFSIGIGVPIIAIGGAAVLTPKFQIQRSEKHSTSVGLIELLSTEGSGGVGYVAHTVELPQGALHVTVMSPVARYASDRSLVAMLGGERRLSERITFITENYFARGGPPIVSGGFRIKAPHTTWDFGLLVPTNLRYNARPAPMINGGWKF